MILGIVKFNGRYHTVAAAQAMDLRSGSTNPESSEFKNYIKQHGSPAYEEIAHHLGYVDTDCRDPAGARRVVWIPGRVAQA